MAHPDIQHLSSLDAAFLHVESAEMPMHVGSVHVLELPPGHAGDFFEHVKAHVASRMHLAKVFTRKLALMPFDLSNPVWVEDEDIDLDHHVRHVVLPRPGTWAQLERLIGRLHSQLLDRSRPLWELTLIEGLETGEMVLYGKLHHAGVDGQAGMAFGGALFDLEPTGRVVKAPRPRLRRNRYQLGIAELAGAALGNLARQTAGLVRSAPEVVSALKKLVLPARGPDASADGREGDGKRPRWFAPRTPFNVAITNQRSWAGRSIPLADVKAIAKASGCTVNDVVLALASGAMRRYLGDYDAMPGKPMSAAVPVSLRPEGDQTANNQVSMVVMTLASDIKDPVERLRAIAKASRRTKSKLFDAIAAIPLDLPAPGAPWLVSGLASMYGRSRLADSLPSVVNVIISNVPGAPVPLYFAGAKARTYYPVSIPVHGIALNITVHSYDGRLDFGLIACRRAVPDLGDLADYLVAEYRVLRDLTLSSERPVSTQLTAKEVPSLAGAAVPTRHGATRSGATATRKPRQRGARAASA
jgi:diacylglycerol O-acyltransferase / wax synthase